MTDRPIDASEYPLWKHPEVTPRRAAMRRAAQAGRRIIEQLTTSQAPLDDMSEVASILEAAAEKLERSPQGALHDGFSETTLAGDPHAFFDHSPVVGKANPLAPPLELVGRSTA